ncbi:hypothetical protein CF65_02569 [Aggregatibacter actinomycetemcomitans HK1651]|nr:hypothetical protein CF65_02569 [Aggregatibacter actinomycetemcomitans HK1651]
MEGIEKVRSVLKAFFKNRTMIQSSTLGPDKH